MGKRKGRRKEKKVPDEGKLGTGGVVSAVPLGLRRNTFRCFLATDPGGSVVKSKPVEGQGAIEMSIWPTRSRARNDLSNSFVERGVIGHGASAGGEDDIVMCLWSWS